MSSSNRGLNNVLDQLPSVPIRTWECLVDISGPLEGKLPDWPSHIQDKIYEAMEAKAQEVRLPLTVVYSGCRYDDSNDQPGLKQGKYFLHIILSEIVARDMRFSSEEMMKRAYDEIVKTRAH